MADDRCLCWLALLPPEAQCPCSSRRQMSLLWPTPDAPALAMPDSDSGISKKGPGRDVRNEKEADERNNNSREKGKDRQSEPRSSHGEKKDAKKENEKVKPVNEKEDINRKEIEEEMRWKIDQGIEMKETHRYKR